MDSDVSAAVDVNLVETGSALVVEPGARARLRVRAVRVVGDDGGGGHLRVVVQNQRLVRDVIVRVLATKSNKHYF